MTRDFDHADPLLRDVHFEHRVVLPVLGLATLFESNSASLMDLVDEAFAGWRAVEPLVTMGEDPLRVRLAVLDGVEHGPQPPQIRHLAPDATRIILQSPGSFAVSDPLRREVIGYVTTALLAERDLLRTTFLEAATLALLSHFDRHPIHAAAIARNGSVVLLTGPSGAGKSTLAHRADAAGFDVLGEDHVWVQLDPECRVWGWPGYARLLTSDREKTVAALQGRDRVACYVAEAPTVCVLDRGTRASLERVDTRTVIDALTCGVAPGFDRFPARNSVVANVLAAGGGWRLTLSANPDDALPLLDEMLKTV